MFDNHSELPIYLGRETRIATAAHPIVCYSRDGVCTRPNCTEPGYHSEVHHSPPWDRGGRTDADSLFLGYGPHHSDVTNVTWHTEVTDTGRLAWSDGTSPPDINHAHHPRTPPHQPRPTTRPAKRGLRAWR